MTHSQNHLGLQLQFYPAGIIPCLTFEHSFDSSQSILFRAGLNFADRKDFSPLNDSEKGIGFGGSIGYKRWLKIGNGFIGTGINADLWKMQIDWKNYNVNNDLDSFGSTDITILQPWLSAEYKRPFGNSPLSWQTGLGFGREINIVTKGREVAQGWMGSLIVGASYTFW